MMKIAPLLLFSLLLLAACSSEQPAPVTYTFKGEVVIVNNCNRMEEELPERVKVIYSLGEAGAGEQLVDLVKLDNVSRTGSFSISVTTTKEVKSYKATAVRPNGKSICLQLPCPSPYRCLEQNPREAVTLIEGATEVTDTVSVTCGCEL